MEHRIFIQTKGELITGVMLNQIEPQGVWVDVTSDPQAFDLLTQPLDAYYYSASGIERKLSCRMTSTKVVATADGEDFIQISCADLPSGEHTLVLGTRQIPNWNGQPTNVRSKRPGLVPVSLKSFTATAGTSYLIFTETPDE